MYVFIIIVVVVVVIQDSRLLYYLIRHGQISSQDTDTVIKSGLQSG